MTRDVVLKVIVLNGHVGLAIKNGAIQRCKQIWPGINMAFVCEARDGAALRKAFGLWWQFVPQEQPSENKDEEAMTYLCVKGRWRWVWRERLNRVLKPSAYPRRLTAAVVYDKRCGREFNLSVMHPDPLGAGLVKAKRSAREMHTEQIREYRRWHEARQTKTSVDISAGDWNERIDNVAGMQYTNSGLWFDSALGQFKGINMVPAHRVASKSTGPIDLIEAFVRVNKNCTILKRASANLQVKGIDHEVVYLEILVKALKAGR